MYMLSDDCSGFQDYINSYFFHRQLKIELGFAKVVNITDQYDMILTDQDEVHTLKWTKYKNNGDGIGLW